MMSFGSKEWPSDPCKGLAALVLARSSRTPAPIRRLAANPAVNPIVEVARERAVPCSSKASGGSLTTTSSFIYSVPGRSCPGTMHETLDSVSTRVVARMRIASPTWTPPR